MNLLFREVLGMVSSWGINGHRCKSASTRTISHPRWGLALSGMTINTRVRHSDRLKKHPEIEDEHHEPLK